MWVVALLLGRELVLGVMLLVLRHYGYPPLQVHYLGKAATLLLLYAFPVLLIADGEGRLAEVAEPFAWALTIWGTALYLLAGLFYVIQVAGIVRAERSATRRRRRDRDPAGRRPALPRGVAAGRRPRRDPRPGLRAGRRGPRRRAVAARAAAGAAGRWWR